MKKFLLILGMLLGSAIGASAQCVGPAQAAVQSAINSTSSGGTVTLCSGTATWTTGITVSGKALKILGAGIGNTVITDTASGNAFTFTVSAANFVEFGQLTLNTTVSKGSIADITGANSSAWFQKGFRLHHIRFLVSGTVSHMINPTGTFGLIDNNVFDITGSGFQAISPTGSPDGSDGGFTPWQQVGLNMGGDNAVFIEDNTFNYSVAAAAGDDAIDAYGGARVVIRHNAFNNAHVGFHGYDSGNRRAPMWIEVYNNTFTNNASNTYRLCTFRGGTGVVHDNVTGGTHTGWDGCTLMVYRASPGTGAPGSWGNCDGSNWVLGSNDFNNGASRSVVAYTGTFNSTHVGKCSTKQENVCTSNADCTAISGGTCSPWSDGSGNAGYACRDQPGTGQNQVRDPIYAWNNSGPGGRLEVYDGGATANGGGISNYLLSGRDYFDNTVKPGYTAFTYPHPLQGITGPTADLSSSAINFGSLAVGSVSNTPSTITLTNNGSATLNITSQTLGGTNSGDFQLTSTTCGASLSIGSSCIVQFKFAPTNTGSRSATYTFVDNATSSPQVITLTGTGTLVNKFVNNGVACSDTAGQLGDAAHPFCTITYANTRMASGDTLTVKAGTYPGGFTIRGPSGTAGQHTVFQAAVGETVIINNGSGSNDSLNSGRIKITGACQYIDFKGFIITNHNQGLYLDDDGGTDVACTNILVDGITVHDVGQECIAIRAGAAGSAPRNFTIQNSTIYNCGLLAPAQNGEGLYVGNSSGTDTTNGVTIKNNTIHDTSAEGIELKGDTHDIIVDGNDISNCITSNSGFGNTAGCIEVDEPRNSVTSANHIIRNNVIHDVPNAGGITKRGIRLGNGATVYNNILYNIGSSYSCILANTANFPKLIYHNTVDCTTANAVVDTTAAADVRNNIGPITSNNLAINSAYFTNYAGHNYHLLNGAAPIGAGVNLTATVPTDKDGVTRTPPVAIGAYEFAGAAAPIINLAPGSNNFGSVAVGSNGTAVTITVTNTGTAILNISSLSLTGTNASDFSITNNLCGSTLAASVSCTLKVNLTPLSAGSKSASLTVVGDSPNSPQSVVLTGIGTTPATSTKFSGNFIISGNVKRNN